MKPTRHQASPRGRNASLRLRPSMSRRYLTIHIAILLLLSGCSPTADVGKAKVPEVPAEKADLPDVLADVEPGTTGTIRLITPQSRRKELIVPPSKKDFPSTDAVPAAFLPGGTQIIYSNGLVVVWDLVANKEIRRLGTSRVPQAGGPVLSGDGKLALIPWRYDYSLWLSDVTTGKDIHKFAYSASSGTLLALALSSSGRWAVASSSGSGNGEDILLWQVDSGERVRRFEGDYTMVRGLAISPNEKLVVGVCDDVNAGSRRGVWIWEIDTGKLLTRMQHSSRSVAFSPDGSQLAVGGVDGVIRFFETGGWKAVHRLTGHSATVEALAFSPDGRLLASGGSRDQARDPKNVDGSVRIWNVASGTQLHVLEGHEWSVASVQFSPDSRYLLSGGGFPDGKIRLWRLANK